MPPRRRSAPKFGALRTALEADLALEATAKAVAGHGALVELARVLADDLDRTPVTCSECGGHAGPDPRVALRYAEALESLGIGSVAPAEEVDEFTAMRRAWEARRAGAPA